MKAMLIIPGLLLGLSAASAVGASPASRLEGVEILPDQVRLKTSDPVHYKYFKLENPPRLVLELFNAKASRRRFFKGEGGMVGDARVTQYSNRPAVVRVALDLTESARYRVAAAEDGLVVNLEEDIIPLRDAAASIPVIAAAPAPAPRPARILLPARPAEDVASEVLTLSGAQKASLAAAGLLLLVLSGGRLVGGRAKPAALETVAFAPEDSSQMIEGLQENLNAVGRRLASVEKQVAQRDSAGGAAGAPNVKVEEDIRAIKEVLRSLMKALKVPAEL